VSIHREYPPRHAAPPFVRGTTVQGQNRSYGGSRRVVPIREIGWSQLEEILHYASWKERKAIAAALRPIYAAATIEAAQRALADFASCPWGQKYPTIVQSWRRAWEHVILFFAFPPEARRII
jgi:hypothetical protein